MGSGQSNHFQQSIEDAATLPISSEQAPQKANKSLRLKLGARYASELDSTPELASKTDATSKKMLSQVQAIIIFPQNTDQIPDLVRDLQGTLAGRAKLRYVIPKREEPLQKKVRFQVPLSSRSQQSSRKKQRRSELSC